MSDFVKRYDPFFMSDLGEKIRAFMEEDKYGDYVDYQDHRELQRKYEALAGALKLIAKDLKCTAQKPTYLERRLDSIAEQLRALLEDDDE